MSIFSGPGCVWQTLVASSHLSARSVELWARCLAHCEGTKPSIIVKFIFVIEIGKLLKVDFVPKNSANTTETFNELISLG